MKRFFLAVYSLAICAFLLTVATAVFSFELPKWFPFSAERSLDEWETKIFRGKVIYKIEKDVVGSSLHALSLGSASAIYYKIHQRFKAQDYPMLSWKWKVVKFPDPEKLKSLQGIEKDDYAARVYVIFPSAFLLASKVLEYVWDETEPLGCIFDSPYSPNIKLIVAQSGKKDAGKWVLEERNILADYRRAFGKDPTLKVGAIALMSDADNTGDVAEAYFDEIRIGYDGKAR